MGSGHEGGHDGCGQRPRGFARALDQREVELDVGSAQLASRAFGHLEKRGLCLARVVRREAGGHHLGQERAGIRLRHDLAAQQTGEDGVGDVWFERPEGVRLARHQKRVRRDASHREVASRVLDEPAEGVPDPIHTQSGEKRFEEGDVP